MNIDTLLDSPNPRRYAGYYGQCDTCFVQIETGYSWRRPRLQSVDNRQVSDPARERGTMRWARHLQHGQQSADSIWLFHIRLLVALDGRHIYNRISPRLFD